MKVVYSEDYKQVYSTDPASAAGRMEAIEIALRGKVTFLEPVPASEEDILKVHTPHHIRDVEREGVYDIAALAAGGAIMAAEIGSYRAVLCRHSSARTSCLGGKRLGLLLFQQYVHCSWRNCIVRGKSKKLLSLILICISATAM